MSKKEYLKMADVFYLPVESKVVDICAVGKVYDFESLEEYAAHAINSHDELVAEVERLRGELSAAESVLSEVDRVVTERIKNGAYDLDDISVEVSQAISRLNRDE